MGDTGRVSTGAVDTQAPPPPAKRRGRETATDMVRSLGLVLAAVVAVWYLAQPPDSDVAQLRVVDPSSDLSAWSNSDRTAPAPDGLPADWRPTVSEYSSPPDTLRVGYNTPSRQYAEFAASAGPSAEFLEQVVGGAPQSGSVDVDGTPWARYVDDDGSVSLVRSAGPITVVVGTLRATASDDELLVLARSVRPAP